MRSIDKTRRRQPAHNIPVACLLVVACVLRARAGQWAAGWQPASSQPPSRAMLGTQPRHPTETLYLVASSLETKFRSTLHHRNVQGHSTRPQPKTSTASRPHSTNNPSPACGGADKTSHQGRGSVISRVLAEPGKNPVLAQNPVFGPRNPVLGQTRVFPGFKPGN